MNKIKKGDKLTIHCYKHNGKIHRTWDEVIVLEDNADVLICANDILHVKEADGRSYEVEDPAIMFFYKKRWFNIIAYLREKGLFYKCNIATPYLIDDGIIKWIDYDLDLKVFPDGGFKILDRNEYNYHKKMMKYPKEIDTIIKRELSELILMKRELKGPFQEGLVNKYYEEYKKL